jgi:hypothetical protein
MGLLDDAIREHLELKRQHGGDPSEIERQEREAFGAGGRTASPREDDGAPEEPAIEGSPGAEPALAAEAPGFGDAELDDPRAAAAAPHDEMAPGDAGGPSDEGTPPADPRGEEEIAPPPDGSGAGHEEDPWLVEETADPAPEAEEDVLEETPDFLQETPEHDRLWFEQKPPRDFDWDK